MRVNLYSASAKNIREAILTLRDIVQERQRLKLEGVSGKPLGKEYSQTRKALLVNLPAFERKLPLPATEEEMISFKIALEQLTQEELELFISELSNIVIAAHESMTNPQDVPLEVDLTITKYNPLIQAALEILDKRNKQGDQEPRRFAYRSNN